MMSQSADGLADGFIEGGLLIDGSGAEPRLADIAVLGGRIAEVARPGQLSLRPGERLDATGLLVTPGFVDIHTHYDAQVTWDQRLQPSSGHGVTTAVMGNCAVGLAPCRPEQRDALIRVIAGVEDIPEPVLAAGVPWNWETYPQYLDTLAARHYDMDIASQIAHSAIRVYVMGQRGIDREPASSDDLARMTALVQEAIEAGALGVSTSRTLAHRTRDGQLAPAETAGEAELLALARGLRATGRGVLELISDFPDLTPERTAEFDLLCRVVEESGRRPLSFTIVESAAAPTAWRTLLDLLDRANAAGLPIQGQVAARQVGMIFGLDVSFNAFSFKPSYQALAHLPLAERVAAMRDPEMRQRILSEPSQCQQALLLWLTTLSDKMFVLSDPPDYEPPPEQRLGAIAAARGISAEALAYELMTEGDGRVLLFLPITNFEDGTLDHALQMIRHEHTLLAVSDGGAHNGLICDASYSSFALTHWARDRKGERVPLPWLVRELTRKPAEAVGLLDRGLIAPGYRADLNLIDFDRLRLRRPEVHHDLPGGGRRLMQKAEGYVATMVAGQVTYRDGQPTGVLPGRLVRGPQPAPDV